MFWQPNGNIFLAPMAGITDLPFRCICLEHGAGFAYTEMVSAKGIFYKSKNTAKLTELGEYADRTGIQLFGSEPDVLLYAAQYAEAAGARVIDINMGCPAPKIVRNGEGSALMENTALIGKIIRKVSTGVKIPVTVKIRKGFSKNSVNAVETAVVAEESGAAAVTVHGRTREQYYSGEADWDIIAEIKKTVSIPVIGNGDVSSLEDAANMIEHTGCDAVMIGRAACGNPWVFSCERKPPTLSEKMRTAKQHAEALVAYKGEYVGVREMRKHLCWYIKGVRGSGSIKTRIVKASSLSEIMALIEQIEAEAEET